MFLIPQDKTRDLEFAKAKLAEAGIDGAIVARVAGVDEKTTYVPGSYSTGPYPSYPFWGYYGYGWPAAYSPGYLQTSKYVMVETSIYSVRDEKLLWSGRSETLDPTSIRKLIDGVAAEIGEELTRQGLVK